MPKKREPTFRDRIEDTLARGILHAVKWLPYERRIPFMGWLASHVVGPLLGWNGRVRDNLALVCPDLPPTEVRRIVRASTDNAGRALIETWSGTEFLARNAGTALSGPGVAALEDARAAGRPVILVTGHIGNYDAITAAMGRAGHATGWLYRRMQNPLFNPHYERALAVFADRLYAADRAGVAAMVRDIRAGRIVAMLIDVHRTAGARLTFMGAEAQTATSAAEWALRYDALLLPVYALRRPDGLRFDVFVDAPVEGDDPIAMTQALNDSLEAQVRAHMGQWFWIHRRWKPARDGKKAQRRRAAARTGP